MNKGRLINKNINLQIKNIKMKVLILLNKPSPYVIKDGKRYKRINDNGNKLLEITNNKIIVINTINNKEVIYKNVSEVIRTLKISRRKITSLLDTELVYKNYIFNRIK